MRGVRSLCPAVAPPFRALIRGMVVIPTPAPAEWDWVSQRVTAYAAESDATIPLPIAPVPPVPPVLPAA